MLGKTDGTSVASSRMERWRAALMVAAALVLRLFDPGSAHAWKYEEHLRIGEQSYRCACLWLAGHAAGADAHQREALAAVNPGDAEACGPLPADIPLPALDASGRRIVDELLCSAVDDRARTYGQSTALSGDHLDSSAEAVEIEGQRMTVSLAVYALRALHDGDHFHPRAPILWRTHHGQALALAARARAWLEADALTAALRAAFFEVFHLTAVGDHFLQDSFAAGHMGFNRGAARPTAAMVYHDRHNDLGRLVRNRLPVGDKTGERVFFVHGDGNLHWEFDGRAVLLRTASLSVLDSLLTIASGQRHPNLERAVDNRIPAAYAHLNDERQGVERSRTARGPVPTRGDYRWIPLDAVHDAPVVTWAPAIEYRHPFTLSAREYYRNQLSLLTSSELGATYGIRLDLGFGASLPATRPDGATSLQQKAGLSVPLYSAYSSVVGFDLGLGMINEFCVHECGGRQRHEVDRRGLWSPYLALRVNLELGKLLLLQAFAEGFTGVDYGGRGAGGMALGITIGKPVRTNEPSEFSGPPI